MSQQNMLLSTHITLHQEDRLKTCPKWSQWVRSYCTVKIIWHRLPAFPSLVPVLSLRSCSSASRPSARFHVVCWCFFLLTVPLVLRSFYNERWARSVLSSLRLRFCEISKTILQDINTLLALSFSASASVCPLSSAIQSMLGKAVVSFIHTSINSQSFSELPRAAILNFLYFTFESFFFFK